MREIKFRVWDVSDERMYYGVTNLADINGYIMQYTGLRDSKQTKEYPNGQEIYEGDIAKSGKRLFVARWNNDIASFVWEPLDGERSYPCFNVGTVKNMEIVGNIYENPELLEGEE